MPIYSLQRILTGKISLKKNNIGRRQDPNHKSLKLTIIQPLFSKIIKLRFLILLMNTNSRYWIWVSYNWHKERVSNLDKNWIKIYTEVSLSLQKWTLKNKSNPQKSKQTKRFCKLNKPDKLKEPCNFRIKWPSQDIIQKSIKFKPMKKT